MTNADFRDHIAAIAGAPRVAGPCVRVETDRGFHPPKIQAALDAREASKPDDAALVEILYDALNRLQANPNDPRAHRQALNALIQTEGQVQ